MQKELFAVGYLRLEYPLCRLADYPDSANPFELALLAVKKGLMKGRVTDRELLEEKVRMASVMLGKEGLPAMKNERLSDFLRGTIALGEET